MWIRWFYSKPRTRSWLRVERKRWKWMKEVKVNERGECERKRWKWDCDWKKRTRCCLIDFCNTISLIVCCFLFMNLFSNLAISICPSCRFIISIIHDIWESFILRDFHSIDMSFSFFFGYPNIERGTSNYSFFHKEPTDWYVFDWFLG